MNLDDMKNTWNEVNELRAQESLLDEASIRRMAHEKSSSRLQRIIISEATGILMALAMLVYLSLNFHKLDSWLTLMAGYGTMAILFVSIVMGSRIIRLAYQVNIKDKAYSTTLKIFNQLKKTLKQYKQMSLAVGFVLPVTILPLVTKLWYGKDMLDHLGDYRNTILISFVGVFITLYGIFYLYKQNVRKIGQALQEAENEIS